MANDNKALGYPDEAPEAKSRDMSKVKFIE